MAPLTLLFLAAFCINSDLFPYRYISWCELSTRELITRSKVKWNLLLVEGVIVADVIGNFQLLHVVNFGSGHLVGVFDRALALLLVDDSLRDALVNSLGL